MGTIDWRRLSGQTILYILFLVIHVGIIWLFSYFPTQDGPSHIYNLVILRDLLNGGQRWGHYFDYQIFIGPSLGFNAVAYPLLTIFDPLVVEKIFLSIYMFLTGASLPIFLKAGQKAAFPVSFLVFPVLFCYPVMMGFYSYIIGIPLLILSLVICWVTREKSFRIRFVVINVLGLLLFWCHLLVFIFFLAALVAKILVEKVSVRRSIRRVAQLVLCSLLPLFCTIWYFWPRWQNGGMKSTPVLTFRVLRRAAKNLMMLSIDNFSSAQVWTSLLFGCLIMALILISVVGRSFQSKQFNELSLFERWMLSSAAFIVLIYFLVPDQLGITGLIKLRLPLVIVLFLLPVIRIPLKGTERRFASGAIACVVVVCVASNFFFIRREAEKVHRFMSGLEWEIKERPMVVTYNGGCLSHRRIDVIKHVISYYGVKRSYIDAGNYEAALGVFNTSFREDFPPRPPIVQLEERPWTVEWERYPAIKYVFGWVLAESDKNRLSRQFRVIWEGHGLSIWERETRQGSKTENE